MSWSEWIFQVAQKNGGMKMESTFHSTLGPSTSHLEGLLGQIRGGNEQAKDELIREAYPRARRLTRFILRGEIGKVMEGQTDHVCSLSYEKFARKMKEGLAKEFSSLAAMMKYLGRIIRHTAIDEVRRIVGPKNQVQFPGGKLPDDCLGGFDTRLEFQEMIEGLSEEEQYILDMKFQQQFNDSEIAESMGISRTKLGTMYAHAMMRLAIAFDASRGPGGK